MMSFTTEPHSDRVDILGAAAEVDILAGEGRGCRKGRHRVPVPLRPEVDCLPADQHEVIGKIAEPDH